MRKKRPTMFNSFPPQVATEEAVATSTGLQENLLHKKIPDRDSYLNFRGIPLPHLPTSSLRYHCQSSSLGDLLLEEEEEEEDFGEVGGLAVVSKVRDRPKSSTSGLSVIYWLACPSQLSRNQ